MDFVPVGGRGGDGEIYEFLQVEVVLNGEGGIFEYIVNRAGQVTHQVFKRGGKVTGIPNFKP